MSKSLNQCLFIGNLTREVETRFSGAGAAIANMSIACNNSYKSKTGEVVEEVEYVNCTLFGKVGEIAAQYLRKGSKVFISGRMKTDKYTDGNGVEKYSTKIIVNDLQFLDSKGDGAQQQPAQQQSSAPVSAKDDQMQSAGGDYDPDIPF